MLGWLTEKYSKDSYVPCLAGDNFCFIDVDGRIYSCNGTWDDGISYLERPELFGGDVDKAEASFNKAIQLFEKSHNLRAGWPTWGHAEAYVYLGRVYLDRGDMIRARDAFEKALLIAPDFVWAREWRDELGGRAGLN